jgi:hypothetical protein
VKLATQKTTTTPKKRKKKSKIYFGKDTQDAIVRYNLSEDDSERNKIYQDGIHRAFDKLAENIINTFKFSYFDVPFEDVKCEVVAFLVMNIHKYDHTKGSKAFSYFSVVAKNYLILHNNNNYKKLKSHDKIEALEFNEKGRYYGYQDSEKGHYHDFVEEMIKYFEYNIPMMFKKKRDIDISFAIVDLLRQRNDIENFNKKALYLLIREMTGVNTNHITKIMNVFKVHYKKLLTEFDQKGIIDVDVNFFN